MLCSSAVGGKLPFAGAARFVSRRSGCRAVQCAAADAKAEPPEGGVIFRRDDLFSRVFEAIFRRLVAPRGLHSPADAGPLRGLNKAAP